MVKKLTHYLGHFWAYGVVAVVVIAIAIANYTAGSTLSGWDNLHPEFNLSANLLRSFSTVWQEYQGLGLLGGMGHGADLIRQLGLLLLSFVLPVSLVRYVMVFGSLLLGGLGSVSLAKYLSQKSSASTQNLAGLATGLFYVLNLGTLQNFYVPFEPFYWFYAALPWLLLAFFRYLDKPTFKTLAAFFGINLLATPLGYLQTNFLVYGLTLSVIALSYILLSKKRSEVVSKTKRVLAALSVIGVTNAFWFLPVLFFTLTQADVTVLAKMNQIATTEVYLSNQAQGSLVDVLLLRGYWWNLHDFNVNPGTFQYLLQPWRTHFTQPVVSAIAAVAVLLIGVGVIQAVWKKRSLQLSLSLAFGMCLFMLIGDNPPTGPIYTLLRDTVPLFGQIFRSAFTKWIVVTSLLYSVLFGLGVGSTFSLFTQKLRPKAAHKLIAGLAAVAVTISLLFMALPSFQGHFLYPKMRLELPSRYHELFTFFTTQPKQTRIAVLPMQSFWGWNFYNWEYRGSGFLWYGITQPILDRAFDVWSPYNETFYHELSSAIYGRDVASLKNVLAKYDVTYLILDQSVALAGKDQVVLRYDELPVILDRAGATKVWSRDSLAVYKLSDAPPASFVTAPSLYSVATVDTKYGRFDPAFKALGNYVTPFNANQPSVVFPFANLAQTTLTDVSYQADGVHLPTQLPAFTTLQRLVLPTNTVGTPFGAPVSVQRTAQGLLLEFQPLGELRGANQRLALPQLPQLELPLTNPVLPDMEFKISLGDQIVSMASSAAQVETIANLEFGRSLPIRVTYIAQESATPVTDTFTLPAEIWRNLTQPPELILPPGQYSLEAVVASQQNAIAFTGIPHSNCDVLNRGDIDLQTGLASINYKVNNYAASCTGLVLPNLSTYFSWLLRWQGHNDQGRSIKWYLTNRTTQHTDLEELLPTGVFDQTYSVLAWPQLSAGEYSLNWETRSLGQSSRNTLSAITAYPVPLETLLNIQIVPADTTQPLEPIVNNVAVRDLRKTGTYLYQFTAEVTSPTGLVTLSQGFDEGWLGFAHSGDSNRQRLPHTQYNGWANAWQLPAGTHQVTLIYWPQLLSFVGLALLGISGFGLGSYVVLRFMQASRSKLSS